MFPINDKSMPKETDAIQRNQEASNQIHVFVYQVYFAFLTLFLDFCVDASELIFVWTSNPLL